MKPDSNDRALSSYWNAPDHTGRPDEVSAGAPVACIATSYTFDAAFFEVDLLPRFLGVKFDHTEREISFLIEREQALGTARACVLVDHTCVDTKQTTLRWDQMAIRVPGGAQHAKIVILAWERWLRIIVSSANLTRHGYRRNREIACVLDFFNGKESTTIKLAKDILVFIGDIENAGWIHAHDAAKSRLISTLDFVRNHIDRWQQAPIDFSQRQLPRVSFVGGYPARGDRDMLSVIDQVAALWGTRKASDVAIMTPFVGENERGNERLTQRLIDLSRRSAGSVRTSLAIPGRPSQETEGKKIISDVPVFFRDAWNTTWGRIQNGPSIFIVPPARKGEKINRGLHAKAISLSDGDRDLLLCGSSNFSPHGMGVGAANIEANLCFQDHTNARCRLDARLPVRWYGDDNDFCAYDDIFWPAKVELLEDESPRQPVIPAVFKALTFNEQIATLTVFFDTEFSLPATWTIARPGARAHDNGTLLLDSAQMEIVPPEGYITLDMPEALRGLTLTCVRVAWTDDKEQSLSGWFTVQTENLEDLLPPEQFRGLTSDHIMNCLISGREPAELIEEDGNDNGRQPFNTELSRNCDPLRDIDTTGYTLYQVRKLGQTLAALAERLLRTVRTEEAVAYRLRQDPLGPVALADALAKDLTGKEQDSEIAKMRASQLAFSLAEIALTLAHACRRLHADHNPGDHDVRPIYRTVIKSLLEKAVCGKDTVKGLSSLAGYIRAVGTKCNELFGAGK